MSSRLTERRLRAVVGKAFKAFNEIEARNSDVTGPRGSVDKECRMRVALHRAGAVCYAMHRREPVDTS
jgi:hypothetical protein